MRWVASWRAEPRARVIADRHYNRQKPGSPQFVPPGRCLVLVTPEAGALWVTSWPQAEYVKHRWAGAWVNSAFRNERRDLYLSSEMIREAIAATRWHCANVWRCAEPALGMISFVDADKVRHKRDPGRCFVRAGFELVGTTEEEGLLAFQLKPERMPEPQPYVGAELSLFTRSA